VWSVLAAGTRHGADGPVELRPLGEKAAAAAAATPRLTSGGLWSQEEAGRTMSKNTNQQLSTTERVVKGARRAGPFSEIRGKWLSPGDRSGPGDKGWRERREAGHPGCSPPRAEPGGVRSPPGEQPARLKGTSRRADFQAEWGHVPAASEGQHPLLFLFLATCPLS
jgi:hypothetical protein